MSFMSLNAPSASNSVDDPCLLHFYALFMYHGVRVEKHQTQSVWRWLKGNLVCFPVVSVQTSFRNGVLLSLTTEDLWSAPWSIFKSDFVPMGAMTRAKSIWTTIDCSILCPDVQFSALPSMLWIFSIFWSEGRLISWFCHTTSPSRSTHQVSFCEISRCWSWNCLSIGPKISTISSAGPIRSHRRLKGHPGGEVPRLCCLAGVCRVFTLWWSGTSFHHQLAKTYRNVVALSRKMWGLKLIKRTSQ